LLLEKGTRHRNSRVERKRGGEKRRITGLFTHRRR
jgi:hypothetical protein